MASTPVLTAGPRRAPAAPAGSESRTRSGLVWLVAAGLIAAVFGVVEWTDRPPAPAPADVPATEFSEARARPVMEHLAGTIGRRVVGTPGGEAAAAYLASTLAAIPGVEVQVQEHSGTVPSLMRPATLDLYRTRNVLARIPGDSASAVLVSAHYDSPPESPGAGDNAASVAAAVEVLRALAAGPRPQHTVVFNFNDGEEAGLMGSSAFLEHPWARDVRAFVNLESAGPRGKAVLFQTGPRNAWLTEEYARSVPRPYGTVLGQDIFQSGLIPSDTDFRVYRDQGGLRGLDVAFYQDGWAYHTALDQVGRVQPGSIQHMGDNTLALVRELATGPLPGDVGGMRSVYYDFLGVEMFAYSGVTAMLLSLVAFALALGSVVVATRRTPLTWGRALTGMGVMMLSGIFGILFPVGAGLLLRALGYPHGWYASPMLAWATFGALSLAGFLIVHGVWQRYDPHSEAGDTALAALAGAVLVWAPMLVPLTLAGFGVAYVPLWWTVAGALGLLIWSFAPRLWWAALLVAWVLPAVLTAQVQILLLKLFVPVAGRFPSPFGFDPVIGLLVGLTTVWLAASGVAALHRAGRLRLASGVLAAVGLVGMVALTQVDPYSAERPKRLDVQHQVTDLDALLAVASLDQLPAEAAVAGMEGPAFTSGNLGVIREAERPDLPPLAVTATQEGMNLADGVRTVRLRIAPGGGQYAVGVRIPSERVVGWSFSDSLPSVMTMGPMRMRRQGPGGAGGPARGPRTPAYTLRSLGGGTWEGTVRIRGAEPLEAEVMETYSPGRSPSLDHFVGQLPEWATASTTLVRRTGLTL
ncbi:MAG TPA: M20/M25/M40 family metallo-hydrolase [Longimicrobiaceae bacterium]|nr:M20/M25/M40 family metallo-hydrolase [Longimicrobiaceae bacterium]